MKFSQYFDIYTTIIMEKQFSTQEITCISVHFLCCITYYKLSVMSNLISEYNYYVKVLEVIQVRVIPVFSNHMLANNI